MQSYKPQTANRSRLSLRLNKVGLIRLLTSFHNRTAAERRPSPDIDQESADANNLRRVLTTDEQNTYNYQRPE